MKKRIVFAALMLISLLSGISCGAAARTATLTIYHAGSLSVPFADLETEFETIHPGVDVLFESGGSNKKISDINKAGITVLMVEQDITEASEYADRIYLVEDGRIVFEGTEEEVSQNEHVREVFLGI